MATVKIKFRPSTIDGGQGSIFYQVIHNRAVREQKTHYHLYDYEWDGHLMEVMLPQYNDDRRRYLLKINDKIQIDVKRFQKIIGNLGRDNCNYTADDVIAEFLTNYAEKSLFLFMEEVIAYLKVLGKVRTSECFSLKKVDS